MVEVSRILLALIEQLWNVTVIVQLQKLEERADRYNARKRDLQNLYSNVFDRAATGLLLKLCYVC